MSIACGLPHPDFLPPLSARQWSDVLAFATMYPFGPRRDDQRAGVIAATIANANRGKGTEPLMPAHFFPNLEPPLHEPIGQKLRRIMGSVGKRNRVVKAKR